MKRLQLVVLSSLAALTAACSSTSSGTVDPTIKQDAEARDAMAKETEARLFAPERLLIDLDRAINSYAQFRMSGTSPRSETSAEKIYSFIQQQAARRFDMLVHEANSIDYPRNRAIAVAALGFSDRPDAFNPIVNAAQDDNPEVVANAIFGLAILSDKRTPPSVVARVIRSEEFADPIRGGAAWTLFELQRAVVDPTEIIQIWTDVLSGPVDRQPSAVLVSSIRGIGISRDDTHVELVARYVSHPVPLVRQAVSIALGRLGSDTAVPTLLALLGPAETNENVRLAARKALQELAGGTDRKYDVEEWKRVFERNS